MLNSTKNITAPVLGFVSGILISYLCFEMLPVSFNLWGLYKSIVFILLGIIFSSFIEYYITLVTKKIEKQHNFKLYKTGILIALGVAIHNFPEGIALGSIINISAINAFHLSIIIGFHCLPEALAFALVLQESGVKPLSLVFITLVISIPFGAGVLIGSILSVITPAFISAVLSFTGGVMLYVTCGDVIPSSAPSSKVTTVISCLGFLFGVFIIYVL